LEIELKKVAGWAETVVVLRLPGGKRQ